MVFDSELGIGAFVSISDKDREIVRRARAANLMISAGERDAILQIVRAHAEWKGLKRQDRALKVLEELSIETPPPVPSRLAVEVVMAAWRAGHLV